MHAVLARMRVETGDLTALAVEAIVVPAHPSLLGGGGALDAAVHRAAGAKLLEECRAVGGCPPGEARLTGGYGLPARWVIHAVGPGWASGGAARPLLGSCYTESLRLAARNQIETVAFPDLAAGGADLAAETAAGVAVRSVAAWLAQHDWPRAVRFCLADEPGAARYRERLAGMADAWKG
jgi:O-acetyl-ADP-ribose deacetylase (regulator of RNase III)